MQVENIESQSLVTHKTRLTTLSGSSGFANELNIQKKSNEIVSQKNDSTLNSASHNSLLTSNSLSVSNAQEIKLGTLSGNNKTVAQLLLSNPELKSKTWSIIHNDLNKNKAFHQIPAGKDIFYNKQTQELSWGNLNRSVVSAASLGQVKQNTTVVPIIDNPNKIALGTINQDNPTVSDLMFQKKELKNQRWDIIHSDANKNKEFTKIPNGTTIYIDAATKELSWNNSIQQNQTIPIKAENLVAQKQTLKTSSDSTHIIAQTLDDAVKPYMGTDYKHLDCYTLVVNGLENMGIRYRGKDSLSSQLLQKAQTEGRASNAYFTGEGITEALGDKVYSKAINRVSNINEQSNDIFHEMKSLMKKGDILSFSLESKGHTGIISQNNEQWTYINSGRLDHSISQNAPKNGVGEETLFNEINNWIKLAQQKNESLKITVGRLDKQKFA